MPGGIGPVNAECATALRYGQRDVRLPASADEKQIFYNLTMDRVHYFPQRNAIYFVDSVHVAVQAIIESVLKSMGVTMQIEQLYLDKSGIFKGGMRVTLSEKQATAVLVALRLKGIQVSVSG